MNVKKKADIRCKSVRYKPGFYSRIGMKPPGIIYLWPSPWDGGKTDVYCDVPNHQMFADNQGQVSLYEVKSLEMVKQSAAYWSQPCTNDVFAHSTIQVCPLPDNILPLPLPISATNGSATWTIDGRGGVTGSIIYTVGHGSGSKKYSSGVVVEFFDGSTYYGETTKTVGRPLVGSKKGTHTISVSSIPLNQVGNIRRVFVNYSVDRGLSTIGDWKNLVLKLLDEADVDYQRLKDNGLVQDAVRVAAGS